MKNALPPKNLLSWLRRSRWSILVLALAAALFLFVRLSILRSEDSGELTGDFVEYEKATVLTILSDSTYSDPASDGGYRGTQQMTVHVESGRYQGLDLLVENYVLPMYGVPVHEGDSVALMISTYSSGEVRASVFEFNRIPGLLIVLGLFFLVTVLVGRKTGLKSFFALLLTMGCVVYILFPLLLRGAPTLPTVFFTCVYITVVSFTILGGIERKSLCAMLGTVAGTAIAMLFGLLGQALCRVDGLRISDVEPLLLERVAAYPDGPQMGLRGLLVAGILISALGAVMDVSMSISSSLEEIHSANPGLGFKALFRSGMNIGQDMVGTMTNTLILAFLGSGFTLILYLYFLGLSRYQLLPSAYLSMEVISGVSSSIGMILAIPLTAFISAALIERKTPQPKKK